MWVIMLALICEHCGLTSVVASVISTGVVAYVLLSRLVWFVHSGVSSFSSTSMDDTTLARRKIVDLPPARPAAHTSTNRVLLHALARRCVAHLTSGASWRLYDAFTYVLCLFCYRSSWKIAKSKICSKLTSQNASALPVKVNTRQPRHPQLSTFHSSSLQHLINLTLLCWTCFPLHLFPRHFTTTLWFHLLCIIALFSTLHPDA
jgi:hypothetical protein